ncbi:hypothetical protein WDW89_12695 [Deltaproteobacteria bacterium TL4]
MSYLVSIDTPGIKKYIFATNRLKEIRGASVLLDELNHKIMHDLTKKHGGKDIYWGGGGGMAEFPDKDAVEKFQEELEKAYYQITGSAQIKVVSHPGDASQLTQLRPVLADLLSQELPLVPLESPILSVVRVCESCAQFPASEAKKEHETVRFLCRPCVKKRERIDRGISQLPYIRAFVDFLKNSSEYSPRFLTHPEQSIERWLEKQLPDDLQELGTRTQTRKGYVGVIYADGNQMGKALSHLKGATEYAEFSKKVDQTLKEATFSAILKAYPHALKSFEDQDHSNPSLAAEILLLGGDDLLLVCGADKALSIASDIATSFETVFRQEGMSLGIGVLLSQSSLPIHTMIHLTEDLLKSAKKRSFWQEKQSRPTQSAIDFRVITASSALDLSHSRETEWKLNRDTMLTARPYTPEELNLLFKWVQQIHGQVSSSRLHHLFEACQKSRTRGSQELFALMGRMKPSQRKTLQGVLSESQNLRGGSVHPDKLPWITPGEAGQADCCTVLGDMLEIYPYLTSQEEE